VRTRRALLALLCLWPAAAYGQRAAFVERLDELVVVTAGTYGDEGARIATVLDEMARALAAWEAGGEAVAAPDPGAQPSRLARRWPDTPEDPVAAYFAHAAGTGGARALDTMSAACVDLFGRRGGPSDRRPFPRTGLLDGDGAAPVLPLAAYAEGYALIAAGVYAEAVPVLRRAADADVIVTDSAVRRPAFVMGVAALREGRLPAARTHLLAALDEAPGSSEVHRALGLVYWAAQQYDSALLHLDRAIETSPRNERASVTRARLLLDAGRVEEARQTLQSTVDAFPGSALAHWWLGWVLENLHDVPGARRQLELAAHGVLSGQGGLLGAIGRLARIEGDFDGALAAFAGAVDADVNDGRAHGGLAQAYVEHDRGEEALRELLAACLIDPGSAEVHAGIGRLHLDAGRPAEAAAALERALALSPAQYEARYALATALARLGNAAAAAREREAFARASREAVVARRRSMTVDVLIEEATLRSAEGWHDRAAALWQQVVEHEPDRASHRAGLGDALAAAGRLHEAIPAYEHAVRLGGVPAIQRRLAELLAAAGREADGARPAAAHEDGRAASDPRGAR
jgi:tetratricopeptide (TPR) repeat protein